MRIVVAKDDRAVELFRLRFTLREAVERGERGAAVNRALRRLLELGRRAGRGDLFYEHRRWTIQLDAAQGI